MKDSAFLSPSSAAKLAGFSSRHITNLITKGKLSATKEDGKYKIEKSEFFRLFPDAHKKEKESDPNSKDMEKARMEVENMMLKEMSSQKDREIQFLRSQLETFNQEKSQMLEAINHHARLLEHKGGVIKESQNQERKGWLDRFIKK